MKIVIVTMIKNESDILETFIRFHAFWADLIVVVNHRSIDSSTEIIRNLAAEGLPVELQEETKVGHIQSEVMTRLMREAVNKHNADWILPLDADEFLVSIDQAKNFRQILTDIDSSRVCRVPWRNYIPRVEDDPVEPLVLRRIEHRLNDEIRQRYKVLVPARLAVCSDVILRQGNHGLVRPSGKRIKDVLDSKQLALAHFPVRSADQIMSKAFGGWLPALAKPGRKQNEASHWKTLFDRVKSGCPLTSADLSDIAVNYLGICSEKNKHDLVKDPIFVPEPLSLKYSKQFICNPLQILAQTAEDVIGELLMCHENSQNLPKKSLWKRISR